jgi:hypothetical protein
VRERLITLGAIAAALVAAGCGGSGGVDSGTVEQAADVTRDARTARVGWQVTTRGFGLPEDVTVRGTGTTALGDGARMDLRFDVAPVLALVGGDAARAARRPKADVVVRGKDVYVRLPRPFRLPDGARWMALDLGRALAAAGQDAAGLGDVLTLDPGSQIEALHAAEDLEEVGRERVQGEPTTRYRGRVDLVAYAKRLPAERRERAERAIEAFSAGDGAEQEQPFEVWIDEADRVRRMRQVARVPSQEGVPEGEVGITMELGGFGAEVGAGRPAAREVYDATASVRDALAASQ